MATKNELLEKFIKEHFPFQEFKKLGFFTKEMKGDYEAQAARICKYFNYKSVYEYGAEEIRIHLSYADGERPLHVDENGRLREEPFITVIPSYFE